MTLAPFQMPKTEPRPPRAGAIFWAGPEKSDGKSVTSLLVATKPRRATPWLLSGLLSRMKTNSPKTYGPPASGWVVYNGAHRLTSGGAYPRVPVGPAGWARAAAGASATAAVSHN